MSAQTLPMKSAFATGPTWQEAVGDALRQLGDVQQDHRLGLVYVAPQFAENLTDIEILLRQSTGVPHWVGTIGIGIIGTGEDGSLAERFNEPGISVLLLPLAEDGFRCFSGVRGETDRVSNLHSDWLAENSPSILLAHGDPGNDLVDGLIDDLVQETDAFMIGGLSAAQGQATQVADGPDGQGLSGVLISPYFQEVQTALSQGCSPIGALHTVTSGEEQVILELDGRPALDVFKEDIGDVLARDLNRCAGYIFAALPVEGSDSGDYTVRNLLAIDPNHGALAIAANLRVGDRVMFCRRDPATAVDDMKRMLADLKRRVGNRPVRGGVYVSCAARGPNQFSDPTKETQLIEEAFGAFPLTGFFAGGEFCRDRIYAYTGVLTLFL